MPGSRFWESPAGLKLLDDIVLKRIPRWTTGLNKGQKEVIVRILHEQDVFWITATGDGKSAAFQVPILVHDEISQHPELYHGVEARKNAIGVIAVPTKGLAANIVCSQLSNGAPCY